MFNIYAANYAPVDPLIPPCEIALVPIGYQGENLARCVVFDISECILQFGDGDFVITNMRDGDEYPYIVQHTDQLDSNAIWMLDSIDTAKVGYGLVQLQYIVDETVCKTAQYRTVLFDSNGDVGEVPDPYESMLDQMAAYAASAQENAISAESSAEAAASSAAQAVIDVAEAIAPMQAQLDEAIAGVTVDSEVINARVDEDGTTYATLGQRLNTEFTDLKSQVGGVVSPKNSSDFTWTIGRTVNASGSVINSAGFALTNIFRIPSGSVFVNQTTNTGYNAKSTDMLVNEYDVSGTWLRRASLQSDKVHTVGADCVSVRIAYGYPQNQSVNMTQELLDQYFSISVIMEADTKYNYGYRKILSASDSIDDLENGVYVSQTNDLPLNWPSSKPGILNQTGQGSGVRLSQTITFFNGDNAVRTKTSSGWGPWKYALTNSDFSTIVFKNTDDIEVLHKSNGEMYGIPTTGREPFVRYKENDGSITEDDRGEYGTDYIKCPPYLVIMFGVTDNDAALIINFYTESNGIYTPNWDILNYTANSGLKNYITNGNTYNRVLSIPEGTFMKVCNPVSGDVHLYGWTGKHFGPDVCGYGVAPKTGDEYQLISSATDGISGLMIPGSVKIVVVKDVIISNIWGTKGSTHTKISSAQRQAIELRVGYDYFVAQLYKATWPITDTDWTRTNDILIDDLNDNVSYLSNYVSERTYGRAAGLINRAKKLFNIKWTCLSSALSISNSSNKFNYNSIYRGTPYMSRWTKACYLGWHVSAHTFVNAANDVRSIFYKETGRNGGPGYGNVCSSFATLVAGFPYPIVNQGFPRDPKCREILVNKPQLGMIMTKNHSHCLIPETMGYGDDFMQYTLYESVSPMLRRAGNYDFITNLSTAYRNYGYIDDYIWAVEHIEAINGFNDVYDLEDVTIVGGTARPYRGDRSVYTSNDTIKINIKDSTAQLCYYQACTYSSATDTFILTGAVSSTPVQTDDSYYVNLTNLTDGFYAVWTDVDDTKEYFEYRTAPVCTYSMSANNFVFNVPDDEFWYVSFWETDTVSGITEIIPYISNGDYSEYRKVYEPNALATGYMFFKGTLGAYVVPVTYAS